MRNSIISEIESELNLEKWFQKGGPGSGHWGHKGRKGKRGGSAPSKGLARLSAPFGEVGVEGAELTQEWIEETLPVGVSFNYAHDEYRAELKAQVAKDLAEASGVTEQEAADFVKQWAHSSNDDDMRSLAIQQDAAKEFGLKTSEFTQSKFDKVNRDKRELLPEAKKRLAQATEDPGLREVTWRQMKAPYDPLMESDKQQALLRAMYNKTQAELKARGIKEVRLYRGVVISKEDYQGMKGSFKSLPISTNSIESWSVSEEVASGFASGAIGKKGQRGIVLSSTVPAERVLSTPSTGFGCLTEGEVVVLGGVSGDRAEVVNLW